MPEPDFNTIAGVDQWAEAFPDQYETLTQEQRKTVTKSLMYSVREGWEPTAEDVQYFSDVVSGRRAKRTVEEHLEAYRQQRYS